MNTSHNRALKEWAIAIEAMKRGEANVLLRKGGIREENGVFRMEDREFFLMPTFDHQNAERLKPAYHAELATMQADPARKSPSAGEFVTISAYAVVETIRTVANEDELGEFENAHIWNERFLHERFDFNPYDPLYLVVLQIYRLSNPVSIPFRPEYGGCKSWVTLAEPISTAGDLVPFG